MAYPAPVIIVPGITASQLRDEYVLPPDVVWSAVLNKEYGRVALHPDNVRFEAAEPARIAPDYIFEVAYKELVNELRHNLCEQEDKPVPVFPFSYDWRQPLDTIETELASFVEEVIERTKLLRHYYDTGYTDTPKVNLVGHSMGGLVVTGYLERCGGNARVSKVVTLATPFRGSFEAVIKISTGTANLGTSTPSSREREAARLMPALYHLLPSCNGIVADPGLPSSFFDPGLWQPSVLQTLREYIRLHSVEQKNTDQQAQSLFGALLQQAQTHRSRIDKFKLSTAGLKAEDWLCVVGANSTTRVRLVVKKTPQGPDFAFNSEDREDLWVEGHTPEERHQTGDGTVPFDGALPTFLGPETVVCVTPDDFGYWEVQDKVFSAIAGFHGILPNMDMLHRLIVRHFTGRPDSHGNTWGRPAPGVAEWMPPLSLKPKG
jgi:pimeloyl-ACP methyl ester carboxylesterase